MITVDGADYLTVREMADVLGRTHTTVKQWCWRRVTPTGVPIPLLRDKLSRRFYIARVFVLELRDELIEDVSAA